MKGNILQYEQFLKNSSIIPKVVLSYGNDKSQLDYLLKCSKNYIDNKVKNLSILTLDLKSSKNPVESFEKTLLKSQNLFFKNMFIHCINLSEKYILPILDILKSKESLYCSIDLSHIPLLYKNLSKYDLYPFAYFVSAYPFKFAEKKTYIEQFFKAAEIRLSFEQAQLLSDLLDDDFQLMNHQLESLLLYVCDTQIVTNEDIHKFSENSSFKHIDALFSDLLLKKKEALAKVLDFAQSESVDPHFIARSFLKYVKKIYYLTTSNLEIIPANFEGISPYVMKLINPNLPTLKRLYTAKNLSDLLFKTNKLESELRETKKDPLQTLNQFFIEFTL